LATLTNQNIELRKTANILEQSNSKLQVERSRLQAEIARLQLECNEQAKQRATLEDNLNRINHELDEILALIDQGQEELDVNP
jgi:septal ring factor EnvC (AmiA/AmiB activator)